MAIKLLSVDDEQDLEVLLSHYFRRKIRKGEYEFFFAHNGVEALKLLVAHPDIDIILSDINMPEMDGLTLLSKINELRNPAQKCIMVSAYGDMKNIRTAMNRGAFDFATKPIDMDDLALTIEKAAEEIHFIKEREQEHHQLESIRTDLASAGDIQKAILPCVFPPFPEVTDLDIFASMRPAKEIGGDFYDFFRIDDTHIGFVMADVSGKGIPAALFMAVSCTLLRAIAKTTLSSRECVTELNNLLCKASADSMFVTVFYGILNQETGQIDYTNAGHNLPYVLHTDGSVDTLSKIPNLVVGGMEDFPYRSDVFTLQPGESLVLYTDGVTEAFNTENEAYGERRLESLLAAHTMDDAQRIVASILEDVHTFVGEAVQSDDLTLLVLHRCN